MGLCGLDGGMLKAVRRQEDGVDYGLVGDITEVNHKVIQDAFEDGVHAALHLGDHPTGNDALTHQLRHLGKPYLGDQRRLVDITEVNHKVIQDAFEDGFIPVISTVAQGTDAETSYNVNADKAAPPPVPEPGHCD